MEKASLGLLGWLAAADHEVDGRGKPGPVGPRFAVDQRAGRGSARGGRSSKSSSRRVGPPGRAQGKVVERDAALLGRPHFGLVPPIGRTASAQVEDRLEMEVA